MPLTVNGITDANAQAVAGNLNEPSYRKMEETNPRKRQNIDKNSSDNNSEPDNFTSKMQSK